MSLRPEASPVVLAYRENQIGFIKLNRPQALNALNSSLMSQVTAALQSHMQDDDVRVVVLSGEGRAFSSGFDLKEAIEVNYTTGQQWRKAIDAAFDFIMQFWRAEKPTVAAIHGFCLAGALELAIACDITIADDTTFVGEPEVRFGAGVVAMLLPWLIPAKVAKEILLTGEDRIPARRAFELGLINQVAPEGQHLSTAVEMARKIARCSPDAVRMTKRAINQSLDVGGLREALQVGTDAATFIEATDSAEKREFNRLVRESGLKEAVMRRDALFREVQQPPRT